MTQTPKTTLNNILKALRKNTFGNRKRNFFRSTRNCNSYNTHRLPGSCTAELLAEYRTLLAAPGLSARTRGDIEAAWGQATQTLEATFEFPHLAHAPLEPLNCVVCLSDNHCEIWAGDQFQTVDQANVAAAAGLDRRQVQINTVFAGGSFGRRAPIHLIWSREDDLWGGRYRPRYGVKVAA